MYGLWYSYEERLRILCNLRLSSYPHEVDEIISDAYLALCEAVQSKRKIYNPVAWLYGTVYNLIKAKYTQINKQKELIRSLFDNDDEVMYDIPYNEDFLDKFIKDSDYDEILDEINREIPFDDLELIDFVCKQKKHYKDLEEYYNSTDVAIKQRLYRLKKQITDMVHEKILERL